MKKYQEKVDNLIKEKILPTKIYLAYEINCIFDCESDDKLIDKIYQAYLDSDYTDIYSYVLAIRHWCDIHETDFDLIDDYEQMLSELW